MKNSSQKLEYFAEIRRYCVILRLCLPKHGPLGHEDCFTYTRCKAEGQSFLRASAQIARVSASEDNC